MKKKSGCIEGFAKGIIDNDGDLKCWKQSHLISQKSYKTELQFGCTEEFVEGVTNKNGKLKCINPKKLWEFQTHIKHNCYGHMKGAFTNEEKDIINCYNNDLSKWTKHGIKYNGYAAEPQFGCAEGFVEGITDKNGKLQCWKKSYLKQEKVGYYWADEKKSGCAKKFVKGIIDNDGDLKCWKQSHLKSQKSYKTEPQFGCAEGFVKGVADKNGKLQCIKLKKMLTFQTHIKDNCYGHVKSTLTSERKDILNCYNNDLLKLSKNKDKYKNRYKTEPQFGCAEGFVKGITDKNGKLQCIKLTKVLEFQTHIKDNCYGHIKGTFTNEMENTLNCYNKDLSKWPQYLYVYTTETQFGCVKGFKEGAANSNDRGGKLKCVRQGQSWLLSSCSLTKRGSYLPTRSDGTKIGDRSGYGYPSKLCGQNIQKAKNGLVCSWNGHTNLVYRISSASPIIGNNDFKGGYGDSDVCNEAITGSSRKVVCLWNGFTDGGYLPYRIDDGKVLTRSQNTSKGREKYGRGEYGYVTQADCNRAIKSSSGGAAICTWSGSSSVGYQLMNIQTRSVIASFGSGSDAWENCLKESKNR